MPNLELKSNSCFVLSKQQTSMLKGGGIAIMLFHHIVFHGYNKGYYTHIPLTLLQAGCLAKICIAFFAFTTGYGLYIKCVKPKQSILPTAFRQWMKFWPVFLVYVLLICCLRWCIDGFGSLNGWDILLQCLCIGRFFENYWYAGAFLVQIAFLFPILTFAKTKGGVCHIGALSALALLCSIRLDQWQSAALWITESSNQAAGISWTLHEFFYWSSFFLLGWAWSNLGCAQSVKDLRLARCGLLLIVLTHTFLSSATNILAFLICLFLIKWVGAKVPAFFSFMAFFGVYSSHMWLNHALIYSYWMRDWFFSIPGGLNYLVLLGGSLMLAFVTTRVFKLLSDFKTRLLIHLFPRKPDDNHQG